MLTDSEISEMVDLEERIFRTFGFRLRDIEVEREEIPRPHPHLSGGTAHTFVRLCPKVALDV
ncbi:hypothetical protein ACIOJE_07570 [Kitasatospora sp. NPDC087861]|uniref:hypothetical protein n=1 Tax=Kitasatospora sp. NPDC087861 TaxID=3364070 RepID=UPI0037F84A41